MSSYSAGTFVSSGVKKGTDEVNLVRVYKCIWSRVFIFIFKFPHHFLPL